MKKIRLLLLLLGVFLIFTSFGLVFGAKKSKKYTETLAGLKIGDPIGKAIKLWGKGYKRKKECYLWGFGKGIVTLEIFEKNKKVDLVNVSSGPFLKPQKLKSIPSATLKKLGTGKGITIGGDPTRLYRKLSKPRDDYAYPSEDVATVNYIIQNQTIIFKWYLETDFLYQIILAKKGTQASGIEKLF